MNQPKERFQEKILTTLIASFLLVVMAIIAGSKADGCLGFLIFLLGGAGLFFYFKRPIVFHCPDCGKVILSDLSWTCGYCDHRHEYLDRKPFTANYYSFLNKCERCKVSPSVHSCHHCGHRILLDFPIDTAHLSWHVPPPIGPKPVESAREQRAEVLEQTEYEIKLTKLMTERVEAQRQLREAERKLQPARNELRKNRRQELEEGLAKVRDEELAVEEIYAAAKTEAEQKWKDNPDRLEQELTMLERWREGHLG